MKKNKSESKPAGTATRQRGQNNLITAILKNDYPDVFLCKNDQVTVKRTAKVKLGDLIFIYKLDAPDIVAIGIYNGMDRKDIQLVQLGQLKSFYGYAVLGRLLDFDAFAGIDDLGDVALDKAVMR